MRAAPTIIGVTIGDVNGVGPEVVLKAARRRYPSGTRLVLIGSGPMLEAQAVSLGQAPLPGWNPASGHPPHRRVTVWDPQGIPAPRWMPGRISAPASRAAHHWILTATDACMDGRLHAMVTAPISKEGFGKAGIDVPGHTELLAERTRTRRFAMMLFGGPLRVTLVTRHLPLREVADAVTAAAVRETVEITHEALPWLGASRARIAVCGLNPHAGDGGKIGVEELRTIIPAIRGLRRRGIDAVGPVPADTVFHQAVAGGYDAVVAMYHDQGLGPLKMLAFDKGVNVTLGLPIVRTSPDHGTAFDIAGRGIAREDSMVQAIRTAAGLARRPNPWRTR